jgi:outer membrane protein TolC
MKAPVLLFTVALGCFAETRALTLKQAVALALQQNPDVVIARLDQQRARDQRTIARDPFSPKIFANSGAAWTYGFPTSIEGEAPSIVQLRTSMSLFDRSQSYLVAEASESLRGAGFDVQTRQQEAAYRIASLYLDAQNAELSVAAAQREQENLTRVQQYIDARVQEGRELAHESNKARVEVLRARQRVESLGLDLINAESSLAVALGLAPGDRIQPAEEEPPALAVSATEDAAIEQTLASSPEVKRLESGLQAKLLEEKSYKAQRLPKIDLVAQYSLLAKYNNFQEFFARFQRNNVELGAAISVPVLAGRSSTAYAAQAEADAEKVRVEINRTRARITSDLRHAYQDVRRAETARDLARADLDLARDQTSIDLAQMGEGRLPAAKTEQDRAAENEKWLALYDAETTLEHAQLNVLHQTGSLLAALNR